MDAVRAAFDKLGSPLSETAPLGHKGVSTPFHVGDPVDDQHAVNKRSLNADILNLAAPVITAAGAQADRASTQADKATTEADRATTQADLATTEADRAYVASFADISPMLDDFELRMENKLIAAQVIADENEIFALVGAIK